MIGTVSVFNHFDTKRIIENQLHVRFLCYLSEVPKRSHLISQGNNRHDKILIIIMSVKLCKDILVVIS